ncbi:MAG: diguanylate cyclase domain-containing protein [bacterium]
MFTNFQESLNCSKSTGIDQKLKETRSLVAVGLLDPEARYLQYLKSLGYVIDLLPDEKELFDIILTNIPNVLLLDIDVLGERAVAITRRLKENPLTYTMPIIIVLGCQDLAKEIEALEAGAEDFVVKPFAPQILAARIHTSMRRNIRLQVSNPLTGLPGATYIEEQTTKRLEQESSVALCYADLDNFKAFNDKYGYNRGDNVIRIFATILNEGVSLYGKPGDFVGHIGGDDFIMVVDYDCVKKVCDYIVTSFDTLIPFQYDKEDMEREYIISQNRLGQEMRFPLMTVSIGIVHNKTKPIDSYLILTELAAEMKEYAKSISKASTVRKSVYREDQRTS